MNKTIIIAEAGVNHNGDMSLAKELIDVAAEAGADYVKFQTFKAENLVTKKARKADYQKSNLNNKEETQFNMLKKLELGHDNHLELIKHCFKKKIKFLSTAFDPNGLDYLDSLKLDFFKIPSGEITNYIYLKKISSLNKPVILSTGMSNMKEISNALNIITSENISINDVVVLHCNTAYPTSLADVNLKAMLSIKNKFKVNVGYSDHTLGIEVPIAAVALGAKIIEKHFTINRNLKGPDHAASLEPDELKLMIKSIRNVEIACSGSGKKKPSKDEIKNIYAARKSIHVLRDMKIGDIIKQEDLVALRPNSGINPMEWNNIIGRKLKQNLNSKQPLSWDHII